MAKKAAKINTPFPLVTTSSEVGDIVFDALSHDRYKDKIKEMITDYTHTVEFEELVMKYAGKEYDNRILKSGRFWSTTIMTAAITSVISAVVALLIAHQT